MKIDLKTMTESLKEKAYKHIRKMLGEGKLGPGDRLSNRALAKEIGISFIPIREAISQLVSEGIVIQQSGLGFFVANPDVSEINEIYGLREALETYAAQKAVLFATEVQIQTLQEINNQYAVMVGQIVDLKPGEIMGEVAENIIKLDRQFHLALISMAGNKRMVKIFHDFHLVTRFHRRRKIYTSGRRLVTAMNEHNQIIELIKNKNTADMSQLIHKHIDSGRQTMLDVYNEHKKEQDIGNDFFEY